MHLTRDAARQLVPRLIELREPRSLVELFLLANLGFLAVDIYVAHSMNSFAHWAEWIPVVFSLIAPGLLALSMTDSRTHVANGRNRAGADGRRSLRKSLGIIVCGGSVVVGVAGLLWHLDSHFFEDRTLKNLVYAAPFAAPLSYAGLGLLGLLNRMVVAPSLSWSRWVLTLALGGFVGNFILSLADHAQNGFFDWREWMAVAAAAFACGALIAVLIYPRDQGARGMGLIVMWLSAGIGILGFAFHLAAIIHSPGLDWWEKLLYSAPVFAPLLFVDLALLGLIGIWSVPASEAF